MTELSDEIKSLSDIVGYLKQINNLSVEVAIYVASEAQYLDVKELKTLYIYGQRQRAEVSLICNLVESIIDYKEAQ